MLVQFGYSDNSRVDIPYDRFNEWYEKYRFAGCHRSVYQFKPQLGFCTPSMAVIDHLFMDVDEDPLWAIETLNKEFEEYRKIFITSGRHIHFLMDFAETIPPKYAPVTLNTMIGLIMMRTELKIDASSQNTMQMRRVPGSINIKNGKVASYFDPITFEETEEPVITGTKKYPVNIIRKLPNPLKIKKRPFSNGNTDPNDVVFELPGSYGHNNRIYVGRKLRNAGVIMERTLKFMRDWLPDIKYEHMIGEGIIDRIYSGKL